MSTSPEHFLFKLVEARNKEQLLAEIVNAAREVESFKRIVSVSHSRQFDFLQNYDNWSAIVTIEVE